MHPSKRRILIGVVIIVGLLLAAFGWALRRPTQEQVRFQGRPVRSWVNEYARRPYQPGKASFDPKQRDPLLGALLEIGTNSVPFLLETQAARMFWLKSLYMQIWRKSPRYYTDADVANNVALALRFLGPSAIPAVARGLESDDWRIRQAAALALGTCDFAADQAVPLLIQALTSPDSRTWFGAASALGMLGGKAKAAVAPLMDQARKGSSFVEIYTPILAISRIEPGNTAFQAMLSGWLAATNILARHYSPRVKSSGWVDEDRAEW